jgi:O-antigen/teichoic acid export membrane protein
MSNSGKIAKNTMALYGRSLLVLIVSLYTSRVVFNALGVEDYGLFNVVGGVISMLGFLNTTMQATFQRYYNVAMGKGKEMEIKQLFRSSLTVQLLLSIIVVLLGETIGLWFLSNKLVIPEGRVEAAQILYQVTIVSFILSIFKAPFASLITAYERMSVYALFSIIETILKLGIVFIVMVAPADKLILYSLLILLIHVVDFLLYVIFCRNRIPTTAIGFSCSKGALNKMLSFSVWSTMDALAYTMRSQGLNILLNLFFGTVVNAARGVAYQVLNVVNQFIRSFQTAFRPQLTKLYASGDYDATMRLYYGATKLSYYLVFTISLPILLETPSILHLWLGNVVPDYAIVFTRIILLTSFVDVFANPSTAIAYAAGNIKTFSIVVSIVNLMIVPVAWLFLKLGYSPTSAMLVSLSFTILVQIIRLMIVANMTVFKIGDYIKHVGLPVAVYSMLCVAAPLALTFSLDKGWLRMVLILVVSITSSVGLAWLVGLNKEEKQFVVSKIKARMRFRKTKIQHHNKIQETVST